MAVPIGHLLSVLALADPHRPLVTCGDRTASRAEIDQRSTRLARAFEAMGVRQGDFLSIALPNSVEHVEASFAGWKLGAVVHPVSPKLPDAERDRVLRLAGSALVVGVDPGTHDGIICVPAGFEPDETTDSTPITPPRVSPAWKALSSGGSTGDPKLIVAGSTSEIEPNAPAIFGLRPDGVCMVPGPLFHNGPFAATANGLFMGNHTVLLPRFDAAATLQAIDDHRVEVIMLVPTMMHRMLKVIEQEPTRYDLSSLRSVWHMAAPCPAWLKQAWIELLGPERLFEMYGGTEAQSITTISGTEWLAHKGSVGKPLYGEMRVLDPDFVECPPGEVGEIFMRRPSGMAATYRYVGATVRRKDDWESIGDLGWKDEDGYLYISDRRTDLILSGGANVYPAEVEAVLSEHRAVEGVAVVGLPDDDMGQRVHAIVESTDVSLTDEVLLAFLRDRLAPYKWPRTFRFVDQPLRDEAGKIKRYELRQREIELESALP